ncbi:DEAD/DEAH box helicase family protein [Hydrogenophaga sp. SL48]|uniref:DEAD/DEAH box helicase family protein n=1 Tax=Hydrogenophaga sp. SL48 TaxID=2806347 RepID=UPI001F422E99|nr:DEAD/DEAH box helicase family protein [Hydrogenophaga sp. SL48]UJW79887.1 DEAD/DEAH box helicase family protein [Hydrogenophaga sp. SL48]
MKASNFAFLQASWPELLAEAQRAEAACHADPRTACFYARRTLELAVAWLYRAEGGAGGALRLPYKADLSAFLFEPSFKLLVGPALHAKMDVIRRQGNSAAHSTRTMSSADALAVLRELFQVAFWLARHYGRHAAARPDPALQFRAELLPTAQPLQPESAKTPAELQRLATELAERDAALAAAQQRNAAMDAELAQLRAEIAASKAANEAQPDTHDYTEEQTRDLYIDLLLKEAGWALDQPRDREFEVRGMPNRSVAGPPQDRLHPLGGSGEAGVGGQRQALGYVDYVLWGDDGLPLAVVEAKRTRRDARAGQQQAKLYADCLEKQFGQRPLIYCTNGYEHVFWDDSQYPPRAVQGFHKKDELQLLVQRRRTRKPLAAMTINPAMVERHYQLRAIRRVGETFDVDRQRRALVVMATGAGKTRTVIALADLLMRANWAKRVLFLADRVALVNQAVNAFKTHLPEAVPVNLVTDKTAEGRVYVSTYPTMMGLINEARDGQAGGQRRFGVGHFDLIVVDEAHRSIYQKYRAIFGYFDALLVGLTATPKDEIDRNTYGLFGLEDGVPTDAYGLDDAIAEGYLVPPKTVSVPLRFQREGIRYAELSEAEREQWDELEWDEDGTVPDEVNAEAVNKWLFNLDTVDKVLETLMTRGHKVAGGDRLGKTIVFAKNNAHAEFIAERFNANYPHYAGQFARVITFKTEYAQSLIDDFSVKDKAPHIAISVDMLDTGIDVPEVVNLVLFKIVRSKAKFWQMLGRGTRLCKDLYGPGQDKADFLVFDFCQNLEFFSQDLEGSDGALAQPLGQRLFNTRLALIAAMDDRLAATGEPSATAQVGDADAVGEIRLTEAGMRRDTASLLQAIVAGMSLDNFVVRPKRQWVETWAAASAWAHPSSEQLVDAGVHLSGLPSAVRDEDEDAKRFDLLMLRLQLGVLNAEPGFERLAQKVRDIAERLLELGNIPEVRKHGVLIEAVAGEAWWMDVTPPMLEQARRHLRALVKLIDKTARKVIYTDFEDHLGELTEVLLPLGGGAGDFERFRTKVRVFLRAHEDHIALHKLRRNLPLTPADLAELDRMLAASGTGSAQDFQRAAAESQGLGLFVRSLVGLDRQAATEALSSFLQDKALGSNQMEFLNLIVNHLTERGVMDPALLYEPPFTGYAPQGPEALFTRAKVNQLFQTLDHIKATATVAQRA